MNNTFTNISYTQGNVLESTLERVHILDKGYLFRKMNIEAFVGPLLGPNVTEDKSVLTGFSAEDGYYLIIYRNNFSSITGELGGLFFLPKYLDVSFQLLFLHNNFLNLSGLGSSSFSGFYKQTIAHNRIANFSDEFLSIEDSTIVDITQNQFDGCTSQLPFIKVSGQTNSYELLFSSNNFTQAFAKGSELISLEIPLTTFEMRNNYFNACTLASRLTSTLVFVDDKQYAQYPLAEVITLEGNHFNDIKIEKILGVNPGRSSLLRIRRDNLKVKISNGVFSNTNSGHIQNLAVLDIIYRYSSVRRQWKNCKFWQLYSNPSG